MPTALIIGAGIGGLASGIALRRAGWDIRMFERAPAPRAVGFALGLAPNAVAALRELGVGDALQAHRVVPTLAEMRRVDGRVIRRFAGRADHPRLVDAPSLILRPALHGALLEAVDAGVLEVNRAAVRFEAGARVRVEFADGTDAAGDMLIGADGVASTVRGQLHPSEPPAHASGYFAVRGLSPAVDRLNGLHAIWYLGSGVEAAAVQAAPNAVYWFISLRATDVTRGALDVASVMRRCTVGFDPQFLAITAATPAGDLRIDELLARAPLASWGAGPVTLLGDAAHPMLPHTGQGAAQTLEDAVALGRVMRSRGDVLATLRRYERVRSRRTTRVVLMGPRIARITTTTNPVVGLLRNAAIRLAPEAVLVKAFTRAGPDPHRELAALR